MSRTYRDHPNKDPKHGPRFWVRCTKSRCWICRYRPKGKRKLELQKALKFEEIAEKGYTEEPKEKEEMT